MSEPVVREETAVKKQGATAALISMGMRDLVGSVCCGIVAGSLAVVLYIVFEKYVFGAVLCRAQSIGSCTLAPIYATLTAVILGSIAGVAGLAKLRIYRPLLIGIVAAVSLWGLHVAVADFAWYNALLAVSLLSGIAYGLFSWLSRIKNFLLAVIIMIILVILIRWVFVA